MAGHPRSSLNPSLLASRNPRGRGTTGPGRALQEPSLPGAWPYPRARRGAAASLAGRTVLQVHRRPAVPASLPFKSPPGTGNERHGPGRGVAPHTGHHSPHLTGDAGPRGPRAPHACSARVGRGGGGLCACAAGAPPLTRLRGGSPPASRRPLPPHLGSHLVGAEAGPEAPSGPRARTIHGVPGVRGRLPRPVSSPGSAPRSRLREGGRREGAGAEEGKRRYRAPAHNGSAAAQAPLCGSAPAPGGPGALRTPAQPLVRPSKIKMREGRTECGLMRMRGV